MSWEEECTENREAVWDSPWDKFITFSLIVSNHGTLFRNCICSQDCTNLPVLRGKGSSASANSCPPANSNTSRSDQLFQEKGVHNLNCALQTCNRLPRWKEEGHPSNLLTNPCLGGTAPALRWVSIPHRSSRRPTAAIEGQKMKCIEKSQRLRKSHFCETETQRNHSHKHEQTVE